METTLTADGSPFSRFFGGAKEGPASIPARADTIMTSPPEPGMLSDRPPHTRSGQEESYGDDPASTAVELHHTSAESLLHEALTRKAIKWLSILDDDTKDAEGRPTYDMKLQMEVFRMASDWLVRSKKIRPGGDSDDTAAGITEMRRLMKADIDRAIEDAIDTKGLVVVPQKLGKGRPTDKERARRARYAAATSISPFGDDASKLTAMLEGGE